MTSLINTYGPEGLYIEYKERLPNPLTLAKIMISFSNTKGGKIIIGVQDKTGLVCGIDTRVDIEEYVMNIAADHCDPIVSPIVELHSYEDSIVAVINVPYGTLKPYHLRRKAVSESSYIRIGSTNRLADNNHIRQMMREAVNESYDRVLVTHSSSNNLQISKISRYQELKKNRLGTPMEKITESYFKKIGIKKATSDPINVGGLLLFGKEPQSFNVLTRAHIKIGRFKGKELGIIMDHDVIEGTLDEQIDQAFQFIRKHIFVSGHIVGLLREDRPTYPTEALREVITNAIIHRDYSRAANEAIMVRLFDDRLEVESPGLLPIGVSVKNLNQVQNTRNPLIARLLFDMNYFDEWGQGISRIIKSCQENGNPPPFFAEKDATFIVTLYCRPHKLPYSLKQRRNLLLRHLKNEGDIQSKEYQALTHVSPAQAATDFNVFIKEKVIKRKGKGRSVAYVLMRNEP
jgi:ATP-dependent DNA helicase RecG